MGDLDVEERLLEQYSMGLSRLVDSRTASRGPTQMLLEITSIQNSKDLHERLVTLSAGPTPKVLQLADRKIE